MPTGTPAPAPSAGGPTQHTQNQAAPRLSAPQLRMLHGAINPRRVQMLRGMAHLEAWDVRRQLLRIFGFGGFSIETLSLDLAHERSEVRRKKNKQGQEYGDPYTAWTVVYRAQVRLTVSSTDGRPLCHWEDGAAGDSVHQPSLGDAHDTAMKTALSQALKRCAVNLGDQFGLSLYNDGSRDAVVGFSAAHPPEAWQKATAPVPEPDDPPVKPEPQPALAAETEPSAPESGPDPLEAFRPKVTNGWHNLDATRQNLLEAKKKGLTERVVPAGADGTLTRIGDLLESRIAELASGQQDRSAA